MHKPVNFASLSDSFILLLLRITETLILNVNAANTKQLSGPEKLLELPRNRPSPRSRCEKWQFFGLKYGQDLVNPAVHLHQEFPGVPSSPRELFSQATSTAVNT